MNPVSTQPAFEHRAFDHRKYRPIAPISLPDRRWPDRVITAAPRWCSVDLRDGNQALIEPMSVAQKLRLFELLVQLGFKEIEVGFPAASQPDYDFVRLLIEQQCIPADVTIQVLTQARSALIERTFEALHGVPRAIVHLYNSTSTVQRERVFRLDRPGIVAIAEHGARELQRCAAAQPATDWVFQYSPESFTGTELDFAVEICDAVTAIWQPTPSRPAIINLPATVEMATPNVYADQVEWFCRHVRQREALIISVHTHNDRGCAVAAAELALMAGADRVEGTLLGNGERTGNMDIVTMAMNLYSQGIDPQLQLADTDAIVRCVRDCTQLPVHPRHPYVGELVYTSFSGSHQDAIRKCLALRTHEEPWAVAYLPIDPTDLGRSYQEVIRINSQSGKGGVAYILESDYGLQLPRWLQIDFSTRVQALAERDGGEILAQQVWQLFQDSYLCSGGWVLQDFSVTRAARDTVHATLCRGGSEPKTFSLSGEGDGVLEAFANALTAHFGVAIDVLEYSEHALQRKAGEARGVKEQAAAYIHARCHRPGSAAERLIGVAVHGDILSAGLGALLTAVAGQLIDENSAAA